MLDVVRQGFDSIDGLLDTTNVLIIVFSMLTGCVVRAGTASTLLTFVFVPGLLAGAWAGVYLVQMQGIQLTAEKDINLLLGIAAGEALAVLLLMSGIWLARTLTAPPDVRR